jgi:hypothetical protein
MKVGASKAGRDKKAEMKQDEIDALEAERAKAHSNSDKASGTTEEKKARSKKIDEEYNAKVKAAQERHIDNKALDFKGDETTSMVEGFKDSDMSDTGQAIT